MLIHAFAKEVAAHAADIAHVGNIHRDGFQRAGVANLRVQAPEKRVAEIFFVQVSHLIIGLMESWIVGFLGY